MHKIIFSVFSTFLLAGCSLLPYKYSAGNHFDDPQVVALAEAAEVGNLAKIDELLAAGVDINATGLRDFNPLYWLFAYGEPSPAQKVGFAYLLQNGADAMQANSETNDPLIHWAARAEDSDYLKMILAHGQNIDIDYERPGNSWSTPLMAAILTHRYENIQTLIEYGVDLEKENQRGETALQMSAFGDWENTYLLLMAGADFTVKDKINNSTIVWELENLRYWPPNDGSIDYREKVVEFLRSKGVGVNPWMPESDNEIDQVSVTEKTIPEPSVPDGEMRFLDVDVYQIGPNDDDYVKEVLDIYNPAVVNVVHHVQDGVLRSIEVEIEGDRQDRVSTYIFEDNKVEQVTKTTKIYQFPKWDDKHAAAVYTLETLEIKFIQNPSRVASLKIDGELLDCRETDRCRQEAEIIRHDVPVYKQLPF